MSQRISPAQYDAWYSTPRGLWIGDTEFGLLSRHVRATPGASVIDVGCGTGWFARRFAAAGCSVTGVDIDAASVAFAQSSSHMQLSFVVGDARQLPFPDRSFDHAICVTALGFVDDWSRALREVVRVARRGWAVGLLNRHSVLWRQKGRSKDGSYAGAHWHTSQEVREALRSMNAQCVHLRTAIFWPSGAFTARLAESLLPHRLPWGAFLLASGRVS
jgi:ubiquinone/menaquinone biosynthesis C-methylase UbiE